MTTQTFNKPDIDTHKGVSAVGYFLFFIPLFVKNSPFTRFHANQALVLFLANLLLLVIRTLLVLINPLWVTFSYAIYGLGGLATSILCIYGCVTAAKGQAKKLPVIGNITLLKIYPSMAPTGGQPTILSAYVAAEPNRGTKEMRCPECGAMVDKAKKFCGNCGAKIVLKERLCAECGTLVPEGAGFCSNCGAKYAEPEPETKERKCPNCGRIAEEQEKFCMKCGTEIPAIE